MVNIYRWGSRYGGNDWCFVRTPADYRETGKPHELVILNHGNGWIMDGTEATANFSEKTQFGVDSQNGGEYLNTNRPDYVQYSNPLIEALLAEGFVVAGAQNDGQNYSEGSAGYGNEETRTNIIDFVSHCQRNYNVTDYCHMIGASNGCLATLNVAMITPPGFIRSVTLLYPLISLYYAWKVSHNYGVRMAYPGATSFSQFTDITRGHDPLTFQVTRTNLVSWTNESDYANDASQPVTIYKSTAISWPRIYCIHSPNDTVTPSANHWVPFKKLLLRSHCKHLEKIVAGQHGDYRHFDVASIISWIKR
jgi:hypothetical protein